jgi:S-(hydroxymethyl)glutathione dehydrogenase/alcohol dehydrogenase
MDLDQDKIEYAQQQFGLDCGLAVRGMDPSDIRDGLLGLTGLSDFVIDTTGHPHILDLAFSICAVGGTVCMIGQSAVAHRVSLQTAPMHSGKRLIFSEGGLTNPDMDIPRYLKLHARGRLNMAGLVTRRGTLDEINELIDNIRTGKAGRVLLEMNT